MTETWITYKALLKDAGLTGQQVAEAMGYASEVSMKRSSRWPTTQKQIINLLKLTTPCKDQQKQP